jgi:hypothetical protein
MNNFWIKNPYILVEEYWTILPNNKMSRDEQMNAITRFCIYFIILCLLFDSQNQFILYAFVVIILIVVFYLVYITDKEGMTEDLIKKNNDKIEKFEDIRILTDKDNTINDPLIKLYDKVKNKNSNANNNLSKNIEVQSGYIDSNGYYQIGKDYSDVNLEDFITKSKKNKKVSWQEDQEIKKNNSRKPTLENPYNNILFSDYTDASNLAEPCNIDEKDVKEMQNLYNSSIYRNIDDVYERENSQRLFYTLPIQTVPNDQTNFANWLYKTGPSCKENSQNCNYYQDPTMTSPRY